MRQGNHAGMLKKLARFRLDKSYTWKELEVLCGVKSRTLYIAVRRGAMSDRIAAKVERSLGEYLKRVHA